MKRTVALGTAWTASAAAAVGLGFLAVSFVDASASPGTQPVAASTTPSAGPGTDDSEVRGSAPSASATGARRSSTGEYITPGGSVYANCIAGRPVVAGVPAAGWWADDSNEPGKVEFERGDREVEVRVTCVDGGPVFVLDDARSSAPSSPASSSPAPATETSGRDDDHDEGDHSGHGRSGDDDRDDSSGRDNSGHGSDDSGGDDSSGSGGSDAD